MKSVSLVVYETHSCEYVKIFSRISNVLLWSLPNLAVAVIFFGRISYDKWGNFQPDENASKKTKEAYKLMHSKKKLVFSNTKKEDKTNAIFINSNIKEKVLEIKQQSGKNIWLYGGAKIASTFLNLDLIDEYRLVVHPVILGKGKPLFQNIEDKHKLALTDVKSYKSGVILVTYKAAKT